MSVELRSAADPVTLSPMVSEAQLEDTEAGRVAKGEGWFVLNAKESRWYHAEGRPALCDLEGDTNFPRLGINIVVMLPGQPMARYHWEADQEDFLVLSGKALLIVESEERPLGAWDFVHCPPSTNHVIIGAGDGPCVVLAVGARVNSVDNPDWGGYPVDGTALRHGAGVEQATNEPEVAYANVKPQRQPIRYHQGWLG
jgi:uncharacterized cupin superfamily protein